MAKNSAALQERRILHFADFSQLIADAELVANSPCRTLGNWNVGQILDHLAKAANGPFDGYGGFQAPWFVRYLIIPFIKNNLLTRPMSPGVRLPKRATALLPTETADPQVALQQLKTALDRFTTEDPHYPHPALGHLALQEWVALTLRHAEMHLSFVIPTSASIPA